MKEIIKISYKAFSINAMYCKTRNYTTTAYKDWSYNILNKLNSEDNCKAFKNLREHFNPEEHRYIVDLTFYFPRTTLITTKGVLSSKAFDVSNMEKPLIDLIFLPKYYNQVAPYGAPNLNIDDKYITDLSSKKRISDTSKCHIEASIRIESLNDLYDCT